MVSIISKPIRTFNRNFDFIMRTVESAPEVFKSRTNVPGLAEDYLGIGQCDQVLAVDLVAQLPKAFPKLVPTKIVDRRINAQIFR